jgi:MoxR-like ATPase
MPRPLGAIARQAATVAPMEMHSLVERLAAAVVGRRREIDLVVAALAADRHILLEGPPGTGKSTLLRAVAHELRIGFEFVEGNAELTPARLVGHFDPARVLAEGYDPEVFVDGPLVAALREGALLYIEELNRVPEETLNVLVTVMSEHEITVPRLGRVAAAPGFRLVAAMNPFDAIGTARISAAIYDRVCRLAVDYQDTADEVTITVRHGADVPAGWTERAVELVRRTRDHPDLRIGSSVRGAIDMCAVAASLAAVRAASSDDPAVSLDAALVALSGRIRTREGCGRDPESIITELWREVFGPTAGTDQDDETDAGKASAPTGATAMG